MTAAARALAAWNRLWFRTGPTLSLAVFRILFAALCVYREVETTWRKSIFSITGEGFHLPYAAFIPTVSPQLYDLLHVVQYPLILLLLVGLFTRFAIVGLLIPQAWIFFADQLNFRNHPYFFMLVLLALLLSPCDDALSVRAAWKAWREKRALRLLGSVQPLTWQRLIQFQVSLVYIYAGLHKLNAGYLSGAVVSRHLEGLPESFPGDLIRLWLTPAGVGAVERFLASPGLAIGLAWTTVILELALPAALLRPRTRPAALAAGLAFHLGIIWLMGIHAFSYATMASYLLFLDPETLPRLSRRLLDRLPGRAAA